ncbi:uncharacterized protein LOC124946020 [Impatiens glandulifera]|uniref:uncharacterized protein LOC124946020 n=1 Tax=Impatiens glandulifera TaxID=253017 RepID=UPI001FB0E6BA|nr:uncharacterized protein LOC124946020 [Impatiens glandulifera]
MQNHCRFLLTGTMLSFDSSPLQSADDSVRVQPMIENFTAPAPEKSIGGTSEYLIQTIQGWNVDDLFDSCSHTFDFSESQEEESMSIWETELNDHLSPITLSENSSIWVPQKPTLPLYDSQYALISTPKMAIIEEEFAVKNTKSTKRKWTDDDDENGWLTVPQICNQSA